MIIENFAGLNTIRLSCLIITVLLMFKFDAAAKPISGHSVIQEEGDLIASLKRLPIRPIELDWKLKVEI